MGESASLGDILTEDPGEMPEPSLKTLISGGGILDVTPATPVIQGVQLDSSILTTPCPDSSLTLEAQPLNEIRSIHAAFIGCVTVISASVVEAPSTSLMLVHLICMSADCPQALSRYRGLGC